jgi:hypothetical protein
MDQHSSGSLSGGDFSMISKLPGSLSPEDPTWLAEVTYRFAFDAAHRPLPPDAKAARLRLERGNRAFAELLDRVTLLSRQGCASISTRMM